MSTTLAAMTPKARNSIAILRIFMAWLFLWPFLDKTFGLGYTTTKEQAWINGGAPTFGFLTHGTAGPFKDFYASIAGDPLTDWLFMVGLLGIGLALALGIGVRIAGISGAIMTTLMWTAYLPPLHNPIIDEHLLEALVLVFLTLVPSGEVWGLGRWWAQQPFVQRNRWLV